MAVESPRAVTCVWSRPGAEAFGGASLGRSVLAIKESSASFVIGISYLYKNGSQFIMHSTTHCAVQTTRSVSVLPDHPTAISGGVYSSSLYPTMFRRPMISPILKIP
jgi:hypothetical protein